MAGASRTVLDAVKHQDPLVAQTPADKLLITQAWDARVREDNDRLRFDVGAALRSRYFQDCPSCG